MSVEWVRDDATLTRRTIDGMVLLPPDATEPFAVTGSGAVVWRLLDEPQSVETIVARLADAYAEDPARVAHDVRPLLDELIERGVLRSAQ